MDLFKGQNFLEYAERLKTDKNCKKIFNKSYMGTKIGLFKM
ncbi:hypothetical protein [Polaribacter sp.]